MLYFTANPRDGISGAAGASCNTCCCQNITMRPGETNLLTIDYAPWSVPLGWVAPQLEYAVTLNDSACPNTEIADAGPPTNINYYIIRERSVPLTTPTVIDMSASEGPTIPVNPTMTYELVPLSGPKYGVLQNFNANGTVEYTPVAGFCGADYFSYKMSDEYGRSIIRTVQIVTTCTDGFYADANFDAKVKPYLMANLPFIDLSKIKTDRNSQLVSFPIYMPIQCRGCEVYRLTIKQPAMDCDQNIFEHFSCFDLRCKDC